MTFYMEAIANDATALIPLLRDGGQGFEELGDAAERAGAILDEKTIRAAREFNDSVIELNQQFEGFKNQVGAAVLPTLNDLIAAFSDVSSEGESASQVFAGAMNSSLKAVGVTAAIVVGNIKQLQVVYNLLKESVVQWDLDKTPLQYLNDLRRAS